MHPLAEDYSRLSEDELQKKITKIMGVMRTTTNPMVIQQAQMLLGTLQEEQGTRFQKYLEQMAARNKKKINDIIDIK